MTFLMTMSMIFSVSLPLMKHPLSMGLILILQTINLALIMGFTINTFWFSYILIMSILSGALVLFIYMASIASNEKFKFSLPILIISLMTLPSSLVIFLLSDQLMNLKKSWSESSKTILTNDQTMNMTKLFNIPNLSITLMIILYLLITMIIISFIVNKFQGSLRMKN
uniref:NADH dehydrogenase subunit 6 n=1 Tax=Lisarda rhypara TaxID=204544 RepID=UPI0028D4719C|nr:NADH dehydrogenase subunit 6 [Lisarda rhypara]WMV02035.1 NADH dehydrogenase subunit 6 [Lisarda rhypara]